MINHPLVCFIVSAFRLIAFFSMLTSCNCMCFLFHEKALDCRDDSQELANIQPDDSNTHKKIIVAAYGGVIDHKKGKYFDIIVDSLLTKRNFSYVHILIPINREGLPVIADSTECDSNEFFKGKCGNNGVIIKEDTIDYRRIVDTLRVFAYEYQDNPPIDSMLTFTWNGYPKNVYLKFNGDESDAVLFTTIKGGKMVLYRSIVKNRKLKWVKRSKFKYVFYTSASAISLPVDIILSPLEAIILIFILHSLSHMRFGG
jgi:hypothetical protein